MFQMSINKIILLYKLYYHSYDNIIYIIITMYINLFPYKVIFNYL